MHVHLFLGYLDPGSGSIIIQSMIGIVAGVGVFGRKVIANVGHKTRNLVSRPEPKKSSKSS